MDQDWDDCYDELEEYEAVTGIDPEKQQQQAASMSGSGNDAASAAAANNSNEELSNYFTGGTLAIDMGTTRLKLFYRSSLANKSHYKNDGKDPPAPIVSVDREGFQSTPSLRWMPPSTGGGEEILVGRLAKARSYDTKGGNVVHPQESPVEKNKGGAMNVTAMQQTIRGVAGNALDQALGNSGGGSRASNSNNPLFVLDASMATTAGSYNVRPIFTYPPQQETAADAKKSSLERYQKVMNSLMSPAGIAAFVPKPVAIVTGAEYYNLLWAKNLSSAGNNSVLVVDVGGTSTCITMVGGDNGENEVMYSTTLSFGGDTFVDLLVSCLAQGFYDEEVNSTSEANNELSAKPDLNDPTALQRLYEASTTAIHELSNKTRSDINIPYLTMDLKTRQPKHLKVGMSRNVIESEAKAWVRNKLVPYLQQSDNQATTLLQALPPPTNLSTHYLGANISYSVHATCHPPRQ